MFLGKFDTNEIVHMHGRWTFKTLAATVFGFAVFSVFAMYGFADDSNHPSRAQTFESGDYSPWRLDRTEYHEFHEYIRLFFAERSSTAGVEITYDPKGMFTDVDDFTVQPAPGSEPPQELIAQVRKRLKNMDKSGDLDELEAFFTNTPTRVSPSPPFDWGALLSFASVLLTPFCLTPILLALMVFWALRYGRLPENPIPDPFDRFTDKPPRLMVTTTFLCIVVLHILACCDHVFNERLFYADELGQYLEPAHYLATGHGYLAWEYINGTRNWLLPGFLSLVMRGLYTVGITDHITVRLVLGLMVSVATIAGLFVLYRRIGPQRGYWMTLAAVAAVGLNPYLLRLSASVMSEAWTLALLPFAILPMFYPKQGKTIRSLAFGAALLGVLVLMRLQILFFVPAVLILYPLTLGWKRSTLAYPVVLLSAFGAVLYLGYTLDWMTYGSFAHSTIENIRAHWENRAHLQILSGIEPWHYYFSSGNVGALNVLAAIGLLTFVFTLRKSLRDPFMLLPIAFILIHSAIPHKEFRFITPALPLLFVGVATRLAEAAARLSLQRRLRAAPRLLTATFTLFFTLSIVFALQNLKDIDDEDEELQVMEFLRSQPDNETICVAGLSPLNVGGCFMLEKRATMPYGKNPADILDATTPPFNACTFVVMSVEDWRLFTTGRTERPSRPVETLLTGDSLVVLRPGNVPE